MKEKRERKKWGLILFMVFIMVGTTFSVIFFGFTAPQENIRYENYKFIRSNDIWLSKINVNYAAFSFLPNEVSDIKAEPGFEQLLKDRLEIDVTSDTNSTNLQSISLAAYQMGLTLEKYNIYVRQGFISNNSYNAPVITCNDSTQNVPVIYFEYSNETRIITKENCIIANAKSQQDFIRLKDRILYGLFGIIQ